MELVQKIESLNIQPNDFPLSIQPIDFNPTTVNINSGSRKAAFRKFASEFALQPKIQYEQSLTLTERFNAGTLQEEIRLKEIDPNTLIHQAILENNPEVIRFLLAQGVSVDYPDENGMSPLTIAILNRCDYAVSLLLEHGANTNPEVKWNNMSLLGIALKMNDGKTARLLFEYGTHATTDDFSMVCWLAYQSNAERKYWINFAEAILKKERLDLNSFQDSTSSALYIGTLMYINGNKDSSLLELLISNGADINNKKLSQNSPLYLAIRSNRLDLVQFCVENGANVNQKNGNDSPLTLALKMNHPEIVQYLLQHGAKT